MKKLPIIAHIALTLTNRRKNRSTVLGDFEEFYNEIYNESGALKAKIWCWRQLFKSIPRFIITTIYWNITMLLSYIKIALRNIKRQKGYSFVNIAGLAIGMAGSIIILLFVHDLLNMDRFHQRAEEIYVLRKHTHYADGEIRTSTSMPSPLAPAMHESFPEIVNFTRFFNHGELMLSHGENRFYETGLAGTDPAFFQMFTFPLVKGNPEIALNDPNSIILTEQMAGKYFGDQEPIGKTLSINNRFDMHVTGIIKQAPQNSHIRFNFLVSFDFLKELNSSYELWSFFRCNTYIILQDGISYQDVSRKISGFLHEQTALETKPELFIVPLTRYILYEELNGGIIGIVYLFSMIASLILIIACINFMNLSTARSINRSKEVGIRKVVGAKRNNLIKQFMGESIVLVFIAFLLALILVNLSMPSFNNLTGLQLKINYFDYGILIGLIGIVIVTGVISGSYPALFLSSFQPVKVLKGTIIPATKKAKFRKTLVVTQFAMAIILMIFTSFIFKQLNLIRTMDAGFNKENVVYVPMRGELRDNSESVKRELLQNQNIENVSMSHNMPGLISGSGWYWNWPGKDPNESVNIFETSVDFDFVETLDMQMVQGRFFSQKYPSELARGVVVNERAVRIMELDLPIGAKMSRFNNEYTIVGVIKDFHHLPIIEEIGPLTLRFRSDENRHMFVKISGDEVPQTLSYLEEIFYKYNPNYPFEYKFLDAEVDILDKYMRPGSKIIFIFTSLAIIISCLGLFGLASFVAEKSTKEIGIRKVLGASIAWLVFLLSKEFTKCVLIANIIAMPLSYLAVKTLLQSFAYRTNIEFWIFIAVGILTLVIALLTVSYQAIKTALANPVDSLKYE